MNYVLATGGFLSGGIISNNIGYAQETILNLPLEPLKSDSPRLANQFLSNSGHAIFRVGVNTDCTLRPLDQNNQPIYSNLLAVGDMLGNCDPVRERSIEGIALATGYRAAQIISGADDI
jgi:glycerol-3-phosphate dehydrogenase subunit B